MTLLLVDQLEVRTREQVARLLASTLLRREDGVFVLDLFRLRPGSPRASRLGQELHLALRLEENVPRDRGVDRRTNRAAATRWVSSQ